MSLIKSLTDPGNVAARKLADDARKSAGTVVAARALLASQATLYIIAKKKKKGLWFATHCSAIDFRGYQAEKCLSKARDLIPALRPGTVVILAAYVSGVEWEWRYEVT